MSTSGVACCAVARACVVGPRAMRSLANPCRGAVIFELAASEAEGHALESRGDVSILRGRVVVAGTDRTRTAVGSGLEACRTEPRARQTRGVAPAGYLRQHRAALRNGRLHDSTSRPATVIRPGRTTADLPEDAPTVNAVIRAAAELQSVCDAQAWRYCFIGGLAVLRWGEPRETVDVDLPVVRGRASTFALRATADRLPGPPTAHCLQRRRAAAGCEQAGGGREVQVGDEQACFAVRLMTQQRAIRSGDRRRGA